MITAADKRICKRNYKRNPDLKSRQCMFREDAIFFIMGDFASEGWSYTRRTYGIERRRDHLARARSLNQSAKEFGFRLP